MASLPQRRVVPLPVKRKRVRPTRAQIRSLEEQIRKQTAELKSAKAETQSLKDWSDRAVTHLQGLLDAQKSMTIQYMSKANNLQRCIDAGSVQKRYKWAVFKEAMDKMGYPLPEPPEDDELV